MCARVLMLPPCMGLCVLAIECVWVREGGITRHSPLNIVMFWWCCYVRILQENSRQSCFNWFVESLMEQKHNFSTSVCVLNRVICVYIGPRLCPLNNNRQEEVTLINKHGANKEIIMNLHVQPRSLKIDHFN